MVEYISTFVCDHRLAYIVACKDGAPSYVKLVISFPLLPGLLKGYLRGKLESSKHKQVDILTYPAVQGYYIEAELFNHSCFGSHYYIRY